MPLFPRQPTRKVMIVRDRAGCGGGIHALFEALIPHFIVSVIFVDVGKPHPFYGGTGAPWWQRSWLRLPLDAAALAWAIFKHQPDWVHLNTGLDKEERSLKRDAANLWIARVLGSKVLVQWHGWDHPAGGTAEFPGGNDGWLCKSYQNATAHLVLASAFREDLQRWRFRSPVHLGTTVVADEVLHAVIESESRDEVPMLLFLSRIERAKGLWELLCAFAELKRRNVSCALTIAGDGPDLATLKERAAELGLTDVGFPGFVSGEEKLNCFRRAAIFCFPSYSEGMPLAVLEAMAMGLPIVASAVGGLVDILEDGKTGFLLKQDKSAPVGQRLNVNELADRLSALLADPGLRQVMGEANARIARERFAPAKVAEEMEAVYRKTE